MLQIRERDRQICKYVNDCQALQPHQIQMLFFGSKSPAYERIKTLADHDFLKRHYMSQVASAPASSPMVFTIGDAGAQLLVDTYGYSRDNIYYATRRTTDWRTMQHLIKVNDIRVAITKACWDHPTINLVEWRNEASFRANPDTVEIVKKGGKQAKAVLPDGYCVMSTPRGYAHCFIEADRGTEGLGQFKSQVEIYQAYVSSGMYEQRFQTRSLRILVVTTGTKRLKYLIATTRKAGGDSRYWFSQFQQITPEWVLTEPVWQRPGDENMVAFYTPIGV